MGFIGHADKLFLAFVPQADYKKYFENYGEPNPTQQ